MSNNLQHLVGRRAGTGEYHKLKKIAENSKILFDKNKYKPGAPALAETKRNLRPTQHEIETCKKILYWDRFSNAVNSYDEKSDTDGRVAKSKLKQIKRMLNMFKGISGGKKTKKRKSKKRKKNKTKRKRK